MRVRRHTAALIITSALFAAGVVAPADAKPGNGNANGHQKLHCRAFHASGVGVDAGNGTTTAIIYRGNREIGTTFGTFEPGVPDADGVLPFTGSIDFTNDKGTLVAPVVGTLDTVTGEFVLDLRQRHGDGRLRRRHRSTHVRGRPGNRRHQLHRDGARQALRPEEEAALARFFGQISSARSLRVGNFGDAQRALSLVTGHAPILDM